MSNPVKLSVPTNPFRPIPEGLREKPCETDYHKDSDMYILEYAEVDHLVSHGAKDTDFTLRTEVEECSRVDRQKYIDSYEVDVGILNILEKVRRTGDVSLLHQVSSPDIPSHEKDSLGRPVQDIVDITKYQVDKIDALNSFKVGAKSFEDLPDDLKKKMSMKEVANMSDEDIQRYLDSVRDLIISQREKGKDNKDESGE